MRENLGLKVGLATGLTIFLVVMVLVGIFSALQLPLISKFSMIQILVGLGVLMSVFAVLVISISTSLLVQRPLQRLVEAIRRAEAGDLKVRAQIHSPDEIGKMTHEFNEMLVKINKLERMKIDAEKRLVMAQEDLKYKTVLEEKAKIINSTNHKLESSLKELSLLYRISQSMTASVDLDELCNQVSDVICSNIQLDDFALLLMEAESQRLEVKAARGFKRNDYVRLLSFAMDEGVSGKVAHRRELVYLPNTAVVPDYLHYKGNQVEDGSFLSIPVIAKNNCLGVLNFFRKTVDSFSESEIQLLTTVVRQIAIGLENASLYARTKELSLVDDLTKVYNRRHFQDILEMECKRARRFRRPLSLLMVDVDHFKKFNDTFGHLQGDYLLVEIATVLANNLREVDTLARYGGEEFAVILPNTTPQDAKLVATKLKDLVQERAQHNVQAKGKALTVSIGVSTFFADANTLEDLVSHADIALYKAKATGRNRVVSYKEGASTTLRMVSPINPS